MVPGTYSPRPPVSSKAAKAPLVGLWCNPEINLDLSVRFFALLPLCCDRKGYLGPTMPRRYGGPVQQVKNKSENIGPG